MNAQLKTAGHSPELLGLSHVLVGSLPATLLTDDAPDRYTVEAVFTRNTTRDEVTAIQSGQTRSYLSSNGYPTVQLHVSDRRLEIENTNLEELHDGLASVVADRLADISSTLLNERELAAQRFHDLSEQESRRVEAVTILAATVMFTPKPTTQREAGSHAPQTASTTA